MGSLSSIYLKKETLETLLKVVSQKSVAGVEITVSINDDSKKFESKSGDVFQNVSAYVSQTKEDRDSKKDKFYVGNGKCFWTDGKIVVAGNSQSSTSQPSQKAKVEDDLPF